MQLVNARVSYKLHGVSGFAHPNVDAWLHGFILVAWLHGFILVAWFRIHYVHAPNLVSTLV